MRKRKDKESNSGKDAVKENIPIKLPKVRAYVQPILFPQRHKNKATDEMYQK